MSADPLVYRLRKRAEIRRQIPDRKSVQEGKPDRIADLLEEAADELEKFGGSMSIKAPNLVEASKLALEALEEIALAGMSGTGQESDEAMTEWHARQAWKFIGIAARQLPALRHAIADIESYREAYPDNFIQPLTDEEIMSLCAAQWASHPIEVARAIEAAHGIYGDK